MPFPKPEITEDNYLNSLNDQDPAEKTAQVAYNPNKELTPDDYLNRFFSRREPEPELDTKKIDRIQRMGRLNTFGRTFSIIGDGLGLGLGANVKRRTPDTTAPMLYQSYEQTLDKHKAEKDAWKVRDYRKELEDDQLGLGNARRKEDKAYQAKVHDDSVEIQKEKNAQDWTRYITDLKGKGIDRDERSRHNKAMENRPVRGAQPKTDKPSMQVKYGNTITDLKDGDYRQLYEEAMKDPVFGQEDFKTLMSQYANQPEQGIKHIVQRYWTFKNDKEARDKQLSEQQPLVDKVTQGGFDNAIQGKYNGPLRQETAPVKQPSGKFKYKGQEVTKPMF